MIIEGKEVNLNLATATANWNKGEHNNKWTVKDSKGKILWILEGTFDERSAMQAIRLARMAELDAFNIGIVYGKSIQKKTSVTIEEQLTATAKSLAIMNENLSEQLDRLIGQEQ